MYNINPNNIQKSFDRIAKVILNKTVLFVNDKEFRITEIEFYYFLKDKHEDNYTHEHFRNKGEWRFHNQGLDITFQSDDISDGGILIRGITDGKNYINGPRNVIKAIFENFGKVTDFNQLVIKSGTLHKERIIKTFRHLPNKIIDEKFHNKYYRYLIENENLKIPDAEKLLIKQKSEYL